MNQRARDSGDFDSLGAASFVRDDSNSGKWDIQRVGEALAPGFVRALFNGGCGKVNFQGTVVFTIDGVAAGAWHDANGETDCAVAFGDSIIGDLLCR